MLMGRFFYLCFIAAGLLVSQPGMAGTIPAPADPEPSAARRSASPISRTQAFIRTGEMVAERDITLFKADLLATYKVLQNDERNLTRLFTECDQNWGGTVYALILQAVSKRPLGTVLIEYDTAGRNWEQTALRMKMLYARTLKPAYTFGLYLNRQQTTWDKALKEPQHWRRTFLDR